MFFLIFLLRPHNPNEKSNPPDCSADSDLTVFSPNLKGFNGCSILDLKLFIKL